MVESPENIRKRAERARRLAKTAHGEAAAKSLSELAAELVERARHMEAKAFEMATHAEIARQNSAEAKMAVAKIRQHVEDLKRKKKP